MKMKEGPGEKTSEKESRFHFHCLDRQEIHFFSPIIFFPLSSFLLLSYPYNSSNQTC